MEGINLIGGTYLLLSNTLLADCLSVGLRIHHCTEFGKLNYGHENPHGKTNNATITYAMKPRLEINEAPQSLMSSAEDEFQPFKNKQGWVYSKTLARALPGMY